MNILKVNKLATNNIVLVLKLIICQIIVLSAVIALFVLVLNINTDEIINIINTDIIQSAKNLINQFKAENYSASAFTDSIAEFMQNILKMFRTDKIEYNNFFNTMIFAYFVSVLFKFLWKFINGLFDLPLMNCLNDYMTSGIRRGFLWRWVKAMGKSALFQLMYIVLTTIFDIVIFMAGIGLYIIVLFPYGYWGLIATALIILLLYTFRLTIFAFWLPSISVENLGIIDGMKRGFEKIINAFWTVYIYTFGIALITILFIICEALLIGVNYTLLGISVVTIMVGYYKMKCMNIVSYYDISDKAFFVKKPDMVNQNA